jgi:hypothetical protein
MGYAAQIDRALPASGSRREIAEVNSSSRNLEWAQIAGLIEISADGSWRPTAFGKEQLRALTQHEGTSAAAN